jgi:hypothetical protein
MTLLGWLDGSISKRCSLVLTLWEGHCAIAMTRLLVLLIEITEPNLTLALELLCVRDTLSNTQNS